ncbi:MAG: GIY-YIG nuclease family protein [Halanaerobiales bacterium]
MVEINSGIYVLEINLKNNKSIKIGALGFNDFKKGQYYYIGSAQTNLKSRVERHLKSNKKFHWHIDYLLDKAQISNYYTIEADKKFECKLYNFLKRHKFIEVPVKGFGASDCKCKTHLLYSNRDVFLGDLIENFKKHIIRKAGVNN